MLFANASAAVRPATERVPWQAWKLNTTDPLPPCLGQSGTVSQEWHNGLVTNGRALALFMSC